MAAGWQFVWWPIFNAANWRLGKVWWEGSLACIYEYSLLIGPLEIRRWTRAAQQPDGRGC